MLDVLRTTDDNRMVIRSFACSETEKLFQRQKGRQFVNIASVAYRRLVALDSAMELKDLLVPPSNRLEALSRDRAGQHSIRINDQYRICFTWRDGNAYDVEISNHYQ